MEGNSICNDRAIISSKIFVYFGHRTNFFCRWWFKFMNSKDVVKVQLIVFVFHIEKDEPDSIAGVGNDFAHHDLLVIKRMHDDSNK